MAKLAKKEDLSFLPDQPEGEDLSFLPDQPGAQAEPEDLSFLPDQAAPADGAAPTFEPGQPGADGAVAPPESAGIGFGDRLQRLRTIAGAVGGIVADKTPLFRMQRNIAAGAAGTAAGMAGAVPAMVGEENVAGRLGMKVAKKIDSIAKTMTPEDQNFLDKLAQGGGSMATFVVPGLGVARGAQGIAAIGPLAARLAPYLGSGAAGLLEASTEAGNQYVDLRGRGVEEGEASQRADANFWGNALLLAVTSKLGGIFDENKLSAVKRAIQAAPMEALQEWGQSVIEDFTDDKPFNLRESLTGPKARESALIGAIIGGAAGAVTGGETTDEAAPEAPPAPPVKLDPPTAEALVKQSPALAKEVMGAAAEVEIKNLPEVAKQAMVAREEAYLSGATDQEADQAGVAAFQKSAEVEAQRAEAAEIEAGKKLIAEALVEPAVVTETASGETLAPGQTGLAGQEPQLAGAIAPEQSALPTPAGQDLQTGTQPEAGTTQSAPGALPVHAGFEGQPSVYRIEVPYDSSITEHPNFSKAFSDADATVREYAAKLGREVTPDFAQGIGQEIHVDFRKAFDSSITLAERRAAAEAFKKKYAWKKENDVSRDMLLLRDIAQSNALQRAGSAEVARESRFLQKVLDKYTDEYRTSAGISAEPAAKSRPAKPAPAALDEPALRSAAEKAGAIYRGIQMDSKGKPFAVLVNDPLSRTTLMVPMKEATPETFKAKLAESREKLNQVHDPKAFEEAWAKAAPQIPREQVAEASKLIEARADTWAKLTGRPVEDYFTSRFAGVFKGVEAGTESLEQRGEAAAGQGELFNAKGDVNPDAVAKPTPAKKPAAPAAPAAVKKPSPAKPTKPAAAETTPGKLSDVGAELWYNRRNLYGRGLSWDSVKDLNPTLKVLEIQKTKVWPRPDYEELVEAGLDRETAFIIKQVYDSISAKPTVRTVPTDAEMELYVKEVARVKDAVFEWAKKRPKDTGGKAVHDNGLLDSLYPPMDRRFSDPDNLASLRIMGGNKVLQALQPGGYSSIRAIRKAMESGWPTPQEAWRRRFEVKETKPGDRVRRNGEIITLTEPEFFVIKKVSRQIVGDNFKTLAEAEAAASQMTERAKKPGQREAPLDADNLIRKGPPRRPGGLNVKPEDLQKQFGFRGVNFGNWTNQEERQLFTNQAYDALLDLSELLNVPAKAISLNGLLGLAFGAQGRGGAAAAHFVPGVNEINLTKTAGAGSLAHEWGHALDHYFATQAALEKRTDPFLTHHVERTAALAGLRPEIADAFKTIVKAMKSRPETAAEAAKRTEERIAKSVKQLDGWIKYVREVLAERAKPESKEAALKEYDALAERMRAGDLGDGHEAVSNHPSDRASRFSRVVGDVKRLFKDAAANVPIERLKSLSANADHVKFIRSAAKEAKAHEPQNTATGFYKSAENLDTQKGGKPYWTTETELFARSFQSYVLDRLEDQARQNDYLTRPQGESEVDRYPQGAERKTINAAFDKLVENVKTRETDQGVALYQAEPATTKKGAVRFLENQRALIQAFEKADISTVIHELGHVFRRDLYRMAEEALPQNQEQIEMDIVQLEKWAGVKDGRWTVEAEEKFARGFERYMITGKAPSTGLQRIFDLFSDWIGGIYKTISDKSVNVKISPEVRDVFDRLFTTTPERAVTVPEAEVLKRARAMYKESLAQRKDAVTPLEQFVLDNGGIAAYKGGAEAEEYRGLPVRFRGRIPADEMAELAREAGVFSGTADELTEQLKAIKARGGLPRLAQFIEEARREAEGEAQQPDTDFDYGQNKETGEDPLFQSEDQTDTPAFKKWFGDSKVVDESGKPLVVYHGTSDDITVFDPKKRGENTGARSAKKAFWFSSSEEHAGHFNESRIGNRSMPVYLKMENPLIVDDAALSINEVHPAVSLEGEQRRVNAINRAKRQGRDGVIFKNTFDTYAAKGDGTGAFRVDLYAAFEPTQIKSATGNRGTFDPKSPNILYQEEEGVPEIVAKGGRKAVPDDLYLANRKNASFIEQSKETLKEWAGDFRMFLDKYAGVISTRLANIDPSLKRKLRRFEYDVRQSVMKDMDVVEPFLKKAAALPPLIRADFDLARKNGDRAKIEEIVRDHGLGAEYNRVRTVLNNLHVRARQAGYDIGYLSDYAPRSIKDAKGFMEFFQNSSRWSEIQSAIAENEQALQRTLTIEEKAGIINAIIRGYGGGKITLGKPGNLKDREIEMVTPEINRFYYDSDTSLIRYVDSVNEAIEARKWFGKGNTDLMVNNVADSIGAYVAQLVAEEKISIDQEQELKDVLQARFNYRGMSGFMSLYRDLEYMATMGSPISALTQIGDIGFAAYRDGIVRALGGAAKAISGKSEISRRDLGLEKIGQEFADRRTSTKALEKIFSLTGLQAFDALGKQTYINTVINKYRRQSKSPTPDFMKRMEAVFGDDTAEVIQDLQSGDITENVKYLAFNEILDIQPAALSEMPEKYLTAPNGRIIYMLKSFTLKQFDLFRRESIQKILGPNRTRAERVEGFGNLMRLSFALILANATADEIKDFVLGREADFGDRLVDNIFRLAGVSKWTVYEARNKGLSTALYRSILPPMKLIDSIGKDAFATMRALERGEKVKGFETPGAVPLVGKLYYWWLGKGRQATERKKAKAAKQKTRQGKPMNVGRAVATRSAATRAPATRQAATR